MSFVIKDNIKYNRYDFSGKESVFEKIVFSQIKHLFGKNVILFSKKKIRTINGIGTIPDGFLIDFESKTWFLIEVEISNHDVYTHVVPQITKFSSALKNVETRKQLINSFEKEIDDDFFNKALLNSIWINDIFKTLTGIIEKKPKVVIILEQEHKELSLVIEDLPFETLISIFEIFYREKHELEEDGIYKINAPFSINLPIINKQNLKVIDSQDVNCETDNKIDKIIGEEERKKTNVNENKGTMANIAIAQIIDCINLIWKENSHSGVFKKVAQKYGVNESTIRDACCRRLGLNTEMFTQQLTDKSIISTLKNMHPQYHNMIEVNLKDYIES